MPTVTVDERGLLERLGRTEVNEEAVTWFDDLCFRFGIELDGIEEGEEGRKYKIDIGANRYDLLCLEGIARSLNAFLGRQPAPIYRGVVVKDPVRIIVDPSTKSVRPFVVGAVLRGVTVTESVYTTLIDLQEKLHLNICRKRLFVAIGVHDLSKIKAPFTYKAVEPKKIKFQPLNQKKEFRADELMEHYKSDLHLRSFLHIIEGEDRYPLIVDSEGVVLSMPPIINGDRSKVTVDAGRPVDLFFECTATDEGKASTVIDTLTSMLSEYTNYEVEKVEVVYSDRTESYPSLAYRKEVITVAKAVSVVGVSMGAEEIATNLRRMSLGAAVVRGGDSIEVTVGPTRHDVIHACDIYEDVAISYGYDKVLARAELPSSATIARQNPINKLSDSVRGGAAEAGFTEALTFSLCSIEDECERMRVGRGVRLGSLALISNPKTFEFQTARYSLLPGILKTIQANKKMPLPLKIFEVSDVVRVGGDSDTGCYNERRLCAVYYNKSPGFELIVGLLDRLFELLEVKESEYKLVANEETEGEAALPWLFPGRRANIVLRGGVVVGSVGVLHPQVCTAFELTNPASAVELNLEHFL